MFKQVAFLLLPLCCALSDSNIVGVSYLLLHTENQAPSVLATPYEYGVSLRHEYSKPISPEKDRQLLLGVEYLQSDYELTYYGPEGNNLGTLGAGQFQEFSVPVIWRYFQHQPNRLSGYGYGPLACVTLQQFSFDLSENVSPFQENIVITSMGLNGLLRLKTSLTESWYSHIDFEVQGMLALFFLAGGRDLSDYSHASIQLKVSMGLGSP